MIQIIYKLKDLKQWQTINILFITSIIILAAHPLVASEQTTDLGIAITPVTVPNSSTQDNQSIQSIQNNVPNESSLNSNLNQTATPVWKYSLWKTITYRIAATIDVLIVGWWWTGSIFGGGGLALLNALISSTLYDLHEMAWNKFGPDQKQAPVEIGIIKTITYRIISILNILFTGLFFTGDIMVSTILAFGNAAIDSTIYFFHELAWSYFGPSNLEQK